MFYLSDEHHDDKEKDLQNFLDQFDKISQGFEKSSGSKETTESASEESTNKPEKEGAYYSSLLKNSGRLDRLYESKSTRRTSENERTATPSASDAASPDAAMSLKPKNTKNNRKKKYRFNRKRMLLTALSVVGALCLIGVIWASAVIATTPDIDADNLYSMLSENSVLYDASGTEIESLVSGGSGLRTNLDYTEMPKNLVNAFVSIEDKTFWQHKGFNFVRIFGAIYDGISSGRSISGTSTITQQLARNLYLADSKSTRTLKRKLQEAYYAVQLERQLSKEQIVEAYMNTIYLGSGANGVEAAAQTYFSKDVKDLSIAECALLASIPKNPTSYSPTKRLDNIDIENPDSLDFVYRGDSFSIWYQDGFRDRQLLVLKSMKEQNYITAKEYEAAVNENIRADIKPTISASSEISSYFADYVISQVRKDLMSELKLNKEDAQNMLYNGGLRIHTTMDLKIQKIAEKEFKNSSNFPSVTGLKKDSQGNALNSSGKVMLFKYSNMFNDDGSFILTSDEYKMNSDGSMTVYKGKRLNIYKTDVQGAVDYSVEVKPMYNIEDKIFYSIPGAYLLIPTEYKSEDNDGNLVLSKDFFDDKAKEIPLTGKGLVFAKGYYQLQRRVIQPQSAMVIMDYKTGGVKAMVGGRDSSGKLLFNRATSPQQPGSSIKPLAVYGPALQRSADIANGGSGSNAGGRIWTAASVIDDAPYVVNGKLWPKNWYSGYKGLVTLRQAVQNSINVCSVKVMTNIGVSTSVSFLKKNGVTSVVESGQPNDMNAAALALGGMTEGISPLEMAAGYCTFPNQGIYTAPICYTTVTNKKGETLLETSPSQHRVFDSAVAFIMTDILHTTVTEGIAKSAAIGTQPVAGKTGTTTDNYDAWFCGFTPYYAASLWIGNDINLELSDNSVAAARLWSKIMKQVHSGLKTGSFPKSADVVSATIDTKSGMRPSKLSALDPRGTVRSEYFAPGTVPVETDDVHVSVKVCADSGYLATPYCPNVVTKVMVKRHSGSTISYGNYTVGDIAYEAPRYYCNLHNLDTATYPINPKATLNTDFVWNGGGTTPGGTTSGGATTPPEDPATPVKPDWLN